MKRLYGVILMLLGSLTLANERGRGTGAPKQSKASPQYDKHKSTHAQALVRNYTTNHEWAMVDGRIGTIGLTEFAQRELGDIVFVELPEVGRRVRAGDVLGTVESVKAVIEIYAPLSGTIVAVNHALDEYPGLVNSQPFGEGWYCKIAVANRRELRGLLDQRAYDRLTGRAECPEALQETPQSGDSTSPPEAGKVTRDEVRRRAVVLISTHLCLETHEVSRRARFTVDLGADGYALLGLLRAAEEEFGIEIPLEEAEPLDTVGRAIDYLCRRLRCR